MGLLNIFFILYSVVTKLGSTCPHGCFCSNSQTVDCEGHSLIKLPLLNYLPNNSVTINISNNNISSMVFTSIGQLTYEFQLLSELILERNNIQEFNTLNFETYFPKLRKLNVWQNSISEIKMSFVGKLEHLISLDLSYNSISNIESAFAKMQNLREVNLQGNFITELAGDIFKGLVDLYEVNLSFNKLKSLNLDMFKHNPSLVKLNMENNLISSWEPENGTWLENVSSVNLAFNRIVYIPPLPSALQHQRQTKSFFNLRGNPTFCGCRSLGFESSSLLLDNVCKLIIECVLNGKETGLWAGIRDDDFRAGNCNKRAATAFINNIVQQPKCKKPNIVTEMKMFLLSLQSHIECWSLGYPTPMVYLISSEQDLPLMTSKKHLSYKIHSRVLARKICANISFKCVARSKIGRVEKNIVFHKEQASSGCRHLLGPGTVVIDFDTKWTINNHLILLIFSISLTLVTVVGIIFRIYLCHNKSSQTGDSSEATSQQDSSEAEYDEIN